MFMIAKHYRWRVWGRLEKTANISRVIKSSRMKHQEHIAYLEEMR
jgi:hypothetical protein